MLRSTSEIDDASVEGQACGMGAIVAFNSCYMQ
jgi:hypothetical protein